MASQDKLKALYKFGQGMGFCAVIMEIGWYSYICRKLGIDFHLQANPRPCGVVIKQGFEDYFKPVFQVEASGGLASLVNRQQHSRIG